MLKRHVRQESKMIEPARARVVAMFAMFAIMAFVLLGCVDLESLSSSSSGESADQRAAASMSQEPDESTEAASSGGGIVNRDTLPALSSMGNVRLGLHVTSDELTVWRSRAQERDRVSGQPANYVSDGDVIPNSPGDWDRIVSLKDKFIANPGRYVWEGPTHRWPKPIINNSSWPLSVNGVPRTRDEATAAEPIRDAAFYAMVLGSDAAADPAITAAERRAILLDVKRALQQIAASKYNDYGNRQRYNVTEFGTAYHPSYQIAAWLTRLIYAYDYAQIADPDVWTADEKAEFVLWLDDAADWWSAIVDGRRSGMFNADGSPTAKADRPARGSIWAGGPEAERVHARVDNHVPRLASVPMFAGLLAELELERSGIETLSDDRIEQLIDYGRQSVMDYLVAEFIPAARGTGGGVRSGSGNMFRWPGDTGPTEGWKYAMEHLGHNVMLADHIARAGDTSVYEISTTDGTSVSSGRLPADGLYGANGPKTLRAAMARMWSYIDENSGPRRYGCQDCTAQGKRYDSVDDLEGHERANEWEAIQGNIYFRSEYLRSIYMRERRGTPPLPENPKDAQGYIENGDSSAYPGVNFMYAQMEGRVWPYDAEVKRAD